MSYMVYCECAELFSTKLVQYGMEPETELLCPGGRPEQPSEEWPGQGRRQQFPRAGESRD